MKPALRLIANEFYTPPPAECPMDGEPKMDGTGAHLGLRDPWWNSGIHDLTDSSLFRWILLFVVIDYVYKTWLK